MIDFSAHPLVETAWLAAHLSDGDLRIVDARWRGDGTSRELYQRGHLPGAVHLDWHADLSWSPPGRRCSAAFRPTRLDSDRRYARAFRRNDPGRYREIRAYHQERQYQAAVAP